MACYAHVFLVFCSLMMRFLLLVFEFEQLLF